MAGRDAYLELGFNQSENLSQTPNGKDERRSNQIVNGSPFSQDAQHQDAQHYADHAMAHREMDAAGPNSDFLAGLILILGILLIGVFAGFFGRVLISPSPNTVSAPALLGVQSLSESEILASGASTDVVRFGTPHSDQMLGLQRHASDSALMLVGSRNGAEASKQWMTVSMDGRTPTVTGAALKDKNGIGMVPVSTGGLVASSLSDETLTLSHMRDGARQWSKDYPTRATSGSEVAIAPSAAGIVMLAPSEDSAFIRMASISSDGFVAWESTFARPENFLGADMIVDAQGGIFATLMTASDFQPSQDLVLFDDRGRRIADGLVPLFGDDEIVGTVAQPSGGIVVLISGSAPRLEYISAVGAPEQTINLPNMQFQDNLQLMSLETGDMLIASTSMLMASQVQLKLERRSPNGDLVAQRTATLPSDASVDAIIPASPGEFLISGSMREDRYAPTDLFVQRIGFSPASHPVLWSDPEPAAPAQLTVASTADFTSDDAPLEAVTTEAASPETFAAVEEAAAPEAPIIASLTVTPAAESIAEVATESVAMEEIVTEETETEAVSEEIAPASLPDESVTILPAESTSESSEASTFDLNAAALSRFVGQDFTTLCRFTCVDTASGSLFPMTGTYLSAQVSNAKQAKMEHTRICEAAGLSPQLGSQPVCGAN